MKNDRMKKGECLWYIMGYNTHTELENDQYNSFLCEFVRFQVMLGVSFAVCVYSLFTIFSLQFLLASTIWRARFFLVRIQH